MDAQNVMEEWEVSSFDGGFDGLSDLQSRRFSGAVEAGGAWLFFRDGDPVAVVADLEVDPRPGDVDAFEGASGRLHEATHPATATLAPMLALGGEVRGQYFTEDTPLSTVHETLSEGGFTGYVELSENVLSGDYYVVYDDGDEDYVGVLGSSGRLITDEEARSKAEGEVGIYSVVAVSLPDVEIPDSGTTAAGAVGAGDADGSTGTGEGEVEAAGEEGPDDESADPQPLEETPEAADSGPAAGLDDEGDGEAEDPPGAEATGEPASGPGSGTSSGTESTTGPGTGAESDAGPDEGGIEIDPGSGGEADVEGDTGEPDDSRSAPGPDTGARSAGADGSDGQSQPESTPEEGSRPSEQPASTERHEPTAAGAANAPGGGGSSDSVLEGVTTRSVPSLDPERTGRAESAQQSIGGGTREPETAARREPAAEPEQVPEPEPEPDGRREAEQGASRDQDAADDDRVEAVREEYEARIEELESELASLREERDRLRERVSALESGGAPATTSSGGPALSAAEALAGTSLFVREGTRGEATLEDAHAGRTDRETLANNLRIEFHTQFEDDGATVDGEDFESWLRASAPYDFVEWLITDLLFEIQSTGAASALRPLYDAIPRIDRIGFEDPITIGEGEETREVTFDVVARNQMGEPLVAATIDEGREPTRAESLQPLIADAEDVALEHDTLAATFSVTSSYFEPDALDAAREATSGSLLGREKYRSYVKLARKQGFHLCLVESREESFHLAVPEL